MAFTLVIAKGTPRNYALATFSLLRQGFTSKQGLLFQVQAEIETIGTSPIEEQEENYE